MKSVDEYALFREFRRKGGSPKGGWEEKTVGAREGPLAQEFGGAAGNRERDPGEISVMTRHSNREAGEVEEARGSSSGCRGGEENVEGEPGGEAEVRGRGGCHGEPLRGLPL